MIGRSKKSTFKYIRDKVWKKLNSWSGMSLSKAGREVLIKAVIQTIPIYAMSIFQIPETLVDEPERMMNFFLVGFQR